ncbi:hypothetical protein BC831DRAFT_397850 [Entophlyctis helioformis]|nr:hypothetical protein BC831DRAFT_397850 [Entophlyctis helioformis]
MQEPCGKCTKTVYPTEKVEAAGKWFHKGCFKCNNDECGITLSLKTFKAFEGAVYCDRHVPKPTHTAVSDSVSVVHALHAPKKTAEGIHKAQVGTGEVPTYGIDSIAVQHAVTAPKKPIENIGNVKKDNALGSHEELHAASS